ncbi:MAG: hypothetical protein IKV08_03310 [Phascolarctobacterium sp.]|nr:hypothetical protein [Phascolarctobacterium sp.]
MRFAVTVGRKGSADLLAAAKEWAEHFGVTFIERPSKGSLEELRQQYELDAILVATADGPRYIIMKELSSTIREWLYCVCNA